MRKPEISILKKIKKFLAVSGGLFKVFLEKFAYFTSRLLIFVLTLALGLLTVESFEQNGKILYNMAFVSITTGMFMAAALQHYSEEFKGDNEDFSFARVSSIFVITGLLLLVTYLLSFTVSRNFGGLNTALNRPFGIILSEFLFASLIFGAWGLSKSIVDGLLLFANSNLIGTIENVIGYQPRFLVDFYDKMPENFRKRFGWPDSELYDLVPQERIDNEINMKALATLRGDVEESEVKFSSYLSSLRYTENDRIKSISRIFMMPSIAVTDKEIIVKRPKIRGSELLRYKIGDIEGVSWTTTWLKKEIKLAMPTDILEIEPVLNNKHCNDLGDYIKRESRPS